ncbi:ligand-effect modulator 3 family [Absidia repens]|uniref:Ligand-effect modulator 3 family n=1 Tax=Absidia repens TaxID=90262 RepID=A0A1X2IWS8_9FUNG|nr:ligand-effect modulator 3 family [Absidia repens]
MINYSYCDRYTQPVYLAESLYDYQFGSDVNITQMQPPAYHVENSTTFLDPSWQNPNNLSIPQCILDFTVPSTMTGPLYMYYRLTNFYQNHRLYIKNLDADQLLGSASTSSTLRTNCDPLATTDDGLWVYPCGLIANSMFNDTASNFTSISEGSGTKQYTFSTSNIAWPTDKQKYKPTQYTNAQIVPPPNWAKRYPDGKYDDQHPPPDLSTMERFMVWMHVAALPDFRKIWARNDNDDLEAGRWRVVIDMNFDTVQYEGTKWLVLSTTTPLGGRNPYLGIAYIAIGALCLFLGLVFTLRHLIKPRKLGDPSYLSWNQPGGGLPKNKRAKLLHKE